jgi:hypothetical protein
MVIFATDTQRNLMATVRWGDIEPFFGDVFWAL